MNITIHRGQGQIGGNIIEISSEKARIVLDFGEELDFGKDKNENETSVEVDSRISEMGEADAVLVTHYHLDHIGLIHRLPEGTPVYMGKTAHDIFKAANDYSDRELDFSVRYYKDKVPFTIKDLRITPFLCDHSAFDSYMILIESRGESVLYTGDFRANGRLDYDEFLKQLPNVDTLIIEGTNLTRELDIENIQESLLEKIAVKAMSRHKGPAFIIMSAMNIDRLTTACNAAKKSNRIFLQDIYTAMIASAAQNKYTYLCTKDSARVFVTDNNKVRYRKLFAFGKYKISRQAISKENYLMCIRPSMLDYLKKLNDIQSFQDGILFYGMWKGYKDKKAMKELLDFMISRGVRIHTLHTSGHADSKTIDRLIDAVSPNTIMPVHTENQKWFDRYRSIAKVIY